MWLTISFVRACMASCRMSDCNCRLSALGLVILDDEEKVKWSER